MGFPDALKSLQTELVDAHRGYEEALKDTSDDETEELFREMIDLRVEAIRQIRDTLAAAGEADDEQGSFMSFVHRAVVGLRATVSGLGPDSLPAFVNGEARILLAYNSALDEFRSYPKIARMLEKQRSDLSNLMAKMDRVSVRS